jgi:hypothetical protein
MNTNVHLWSHLAQFFLEWEIFRTKLVQKNQNTLFRFSNIFFRKSCRLLNTVEKYSRVGKATDDKMADAHFMGARGYKHTLTEYVIIIAFPL